MCRETYGTADKYVFREPRHPLGLFWLHFSYQGITDYYKLTITSKR